jgi:phosphoenolpyruvate synthase/pyruvate phosphate dikinase
MLLPILPKLPENLDLALTYPQSVLCTDLSFRGNLPPVFQKVYGIDYSPEYVVYDAMKQYWDLSGTVQFNRQLCPDLKPDIVAQKSITITAHTARQLVRTAQIVSSPTRWRKSHIRQDLLEDLNIFWDAYEEHMTCLYTFWNVEKLYTNNLIDELINCGFKSEVDAGLPNFVVPSEPNWFSLEQLNLSILKSRFVDSSDDKKTFDAVSCHANTFGFMFTVANVGTAPSVEDMISRMKQLDVSASGRIDAKWPDGLPKTLIQMGNLERELTFWKHERIDAFTLADYYAAPMYKAVSDLLNLPLDLVFSMTRDELSKAISDGLDIQIGILKQRSTKYCLALINGEIGFYQPTSTDTHKESKEAKNGDTLQGLPTSPGVVRGRARIISMDEDNPVLAQDEIIVTKMTRPELGAGLDIALAYVTDEGGRLCHAAIVSREKKKPCVVGLGNVTEMLRSGMIIEVDGSEGTVTVIDTDYNIN